MVAMDIVNLYENYNKYFDEDLKTIFEICSKVASDSGFKIFLIGGIVRDLLLERKNLDIDITVEGDAIKFCKILEQQKIGRIISIHEDFGTAKIEINSKKVDFASTRSEYYPKKGHLPVIKKIGCQLKEDVERRDFTINSLALSLNQEDFASLHDFVGGFEDLKTNTLRLLHDNSFIDDPTRIIRALKFAVRFGFELDEKTFLLQEDYLNNINYDMGYNRVKNELKLTFNLNSNLALTRFIQHRIYKLIIQDENTFLKVKSQIIKFDFEQTIQQYSVKKPWIVYFGALAVLGDEEIISKLALTQKELTIINEAKKYMTPVDFAGDYSIYKAFTSLHRESLLIASIFSNSEDIYRYLDKLSMIKLAVTGDDLIKIGFKPSRIFGEIFDYVLQRKLEKPLMSYEDEISLINQHFSASL